MDKSIILGKIKLGVCYYPEHWPRELWESDLKRMQEHGLEIIRVGEFAWSKFEPTEGVFTFEFFDSFLDLAHEMGMKVIFGTPTATPPAWLTHKYPEVLNASKNGQLFHHGMRRHYNYNSPIYIQFVQRIVEMLASHYQNHPAIIGWQIDNELNCEINEFYSEADHHAFREYLKQKYRDLDAFNDAMGTVFWNQTYSSWDEVYLSRHILYNANNPHLLLEEKRFWAHSAIKFCKLQADILRKYLRPGQFITTNGLFGHLDSHEMTDAALDFITYDSYPNFAYALDADPSKDEIKDRRNGMTLSKARSISSNFGVMEQQSGPGGWTFRVMQPAPKPGQMRLWTFQSIAHGADFISYFRWRTACVGTEIYWHGLNDYCNLPNRRLQELKQIYNDVQKIAGIAGAKYQAKIALVKDYDNEWDGEHDQWYGPLNRLSEEAWYAAAQFTHTPMDLVYLRDGVSTTDLDKYTLLVYPHPAILTKERAELLKEYVAHGGTLIMGARTGYKDQYGRCLMMPMPGYAAEIFNMRVEDFTLLGPYDAAQYALWDDVMLDAPLFNDILLPYTDSSCQVLARYSGNYYHGAPALVCNSTGKGKAYYFGAGFSTQTAEAFLRKLGFAEPYGDIVQLPKEVEIAIRAKDDVCYMFVLNYAPHPINIVVKKEQKEVLSGNYLVGNITMEAYGVIVLEVQIG